MSQANTTAKKDRKEYYKNYQKYHYKKTRKMITFALLNDEYAKFKTLADKFGFTANGFAKNITLDYLGNIPTKHQTPNHRTKKATPRVYENKQRNSHQHQSNGLQLKHRTECRYKDTHRLT